MNFTAKTSLKTTLHKTLPALATLAALGLAAHPAGAQTILTAANSNVGAPGAPGGGTADTNGTFVGNSGSSGYDANAGTFIVNGPALVGGAGGATTGTNAAANYQGGTGGNGLSVFGLGTPVNATVNSGTFTGGLGGAAGGVGNQLSGGYGGGGVIVFSGTATINGGTFQGGDSGLAAGTGTLSSGFAGSGLNANTFSTVNVFGGSFTGGNANSDGSAGDGLIDLAGTLNVYGGSFTGGTNGFGIDVFVGNTTLYGTDFFVNGVPFAGGSLMPGTGTITGNFQSNTAPTTLTYQLLPIGGTLNIVSPVPEASTTV